VIIKTVVVALLALLLLVPIAMIRDLIGERQMRRDQAVSEIALGWGGRQIVTGPYVLVRYTRKWTEVVKEIEGGKPRERRTEHAESGLIRLPVDAVSWSITAEATQKARGIHKARLYTGRLQANGRITIPARFGVTDRQSRYEWGSARFVVGIADPRGIRNAAPLVFGESGHEFAPGPGDTTLASGVHAELQALNVQEARTHEFSLAIELAGAEAFAVAPLAKDTAVALRADWPHPSFFGPFLPVSHDIRADGFTASWKVSQYAAQGANRLRECTSGRICPQLVDQVLGVSFIEPIGVYQQLDRASKYGFLFVGLKFAAFFLFELLKRLAIHPIQYGLVGLAIAMFFLLLTALSEHVAFASAYLAATIACVGLVTFYVVRVLRSTVLGLAFGGGLAALHGALYTLLKAEDHALLGGSVLLFALLAGVMVLTRRVDWYRLTHSRASAEAGGAA
jgi:inner membrane protein